jgi:hypothetical protein
MAVHPSWGGREPVGEMATHVVVVAVLCPFDKYSVLAAVHFLKRVVK